VSPLAPKWIAESSEAEEEEEEEEGEGGGGRRRGKGRGEKDEDKEGVKRREHKRRRNEQSGCGIREHCDGGGSNCELQWCTVALQRCVCSAAAIGWKQRRKQS